MIDNNLTKSLSDQLNGLIDKFKGFVKKAKHSDLSDLNEPELMVFITSSRAAIHRISSTSPMYEKQVEEIMNMKTHISRKATLIVGVVVSLSDDLKSGYIESFRELIHGELFSDFIEMSEHLQNEGYKDAAAVIAGSTLEAHLRQLCTKNSLDITYEHNGKIRSKKADRLNSDLKNAEVYSKGDQKSIVAWLDTKNDASHGHYDKYTKEKVDSMKSGIREFITRNPA